MPFAWVSAGLGINQALGNPIGNAVTGGSSPPNVNTSGTQATTLPSWYTAYMQGALGTGQALASNPYPAYSGQQIAPFNDTQQTAFNATNQAQGSWAPTLNAGLGAAGAVPGIAGTAAGTGNQYGALGATTAQSQGGLSNAYGAGAVQATAPGSQSFVQPGVANQWMSPYTQNVVDSIAQQGNQNWNTNLMPGIESQFISGGNPNSASNAAALSVGASQEQANITAAQSQALQAGYTQAMTGQQTANAQNLQSQGLQAQTGLGAATAATGAGQLGVSGAGLGANTAISGGQLGTTAGLGAAGALQSGAQAGQTMTYNDIAQQLAAGNQQQALSQTADTTAYNQFMQQAQYPQTQLSWLNSIASGAQLPTNTSATGSAPLAGATYGPSAAALGYAAYNQYKSTNTPNNATPAAASPNTALGSMDPANTSAGGYGYASPLKRGGLVAATKKAKGGKVGALAAAASRPRKGPSPLAAAGRSKPMPRKGPSPLAACMGGGV